MESRVVPARFEHAVAMAPRMRAADCAECWAIANVEPLEALRISLEWSLYAWTWLVDEQPACMFGIGTTSLIGNAGSPWLLSTDLVAEHRVTFLRGCKPYLAHLRGKFPYLHNVVDARYVTCVKWLKRLGFVVHDAEPIGPAGALFHRFEIGE
ncbi:hypothetical protein B0G81_6813 [Paraburkholderia sp. BL6665CI2N2]|nr:hypothetical protein B0G81_6813 [Paraburkholderia sp. BL6665CI2N2]